MIYDFGVYPGWADIPLPPGTNSPHLPFYEGSSLLCHAQDCLDFKQPWPSAEEEKKEMGRNALKVAVQASVC